jgi:uncharacterized repeat protein (TIGR03803 family)
MIKPNEKFLTAPTLVAHPLLWTALMLATGFVAGQLQAQTFSLLHTFAGSPYSTNSDGANPYAPLIISGDTLYGTASQGGVWGYGTVFKLSTNGTIFTTLHSFTGSDGARPYAGLVLSANTLYGTTYNGGNSTNGTVFKINTDGTGFASLHSFSPSFGQINSEGANPYASLIISSNTLYGTAQNGGSSGNGTLFKINNDGTGFAVLHTFTPTPSLTNADGANPYSHLIISGNTLYGTTQKGGYLGGGAVFKVNTDGTGFANLSGINGGLYSLLLSGGVLYGAGSSALFKLNTDGTGFTNFYKFALGHFNYSWNAETNSDGIAPYSDLVLSGDTLYSTAGQGGAVGVGTLYRVNTDGRGFTNLHNFGYAYGPFDYADGFYPYASLVLSGDTLFGTAYAGGISPGDGTIFSFSLASTNIFVPPRLSILPFGASVIVTWPTNAIGFTLQSTPALLSPVTWSNVSPGPVIVYGQNTVLMSPSGTQQFFRLSQ